MAQKAKSTAPTLAASKRRSQAASTSAACFAASLVDARAAPMRSSSTRSARTECVEVRSAIMSASENVSRAVRSSSEAAVRSDTKLAQ